jgi:hypothetical protein
MLEPGVDSEEEGVVDAVCDALGLPPTPATIATALRGLDEHHLDWDAMKAGWQYQQRKWVVRLMMVEASRRGGLDGAYVRGLVELTTQLQRNIKPGCLVGWFLEKPVLAAWRHALKQVGQDPRQLLGPVTALAMAVRGVPQPPDWLASVRVPPPPASAQPSPTPAPPALLDLTQASSTHAAPAKEAAKRSRQPDKESSGSEGKRAAAAPSSQQPAQSPANAAAQARAGAQMRQLLVSASPPGGEMSPVAHTDGTDLTESTQETTVMEGHDAASQAGGEPSPVHNSATPAEGSAPLNCTALALTHCSLAPSDGDDSRTSSPFLPHSLQSNPRESEAGHASASNGGRSQHANGSSMTVSTAGKGSLPVGTHVRGRYLASSRGKKWNQWYDGTVASVQCGAGGKLLYSIDYFDGDCEHGVLAKHIRTVTPSQPGARTVWPAQER